jgi:DNA-binding NarL/FixJ family response regulator
MATAGDLRDTYRMRAWALDRLVAEVERLSIRGLPRAEYFRELSLRIQRTIPFDGACWRGLDPQTLLITTVNPEDLFERGLVPPEFHVSGAQIIYASEYERDDINALAALARRRVPVGILRQATGGHPEQSARYRQLFAPIGQTDELRAVFRIRRRAWGSVQLGRRGISHFTPQEARAISRLSRPIAEGWRASILAETARRPEHDRAPGLVILGPHDEVELITPAAREMLDLLRCRSPAVLSTGAPPTAVRALAAIARRHGRDQPGRLVRGLLVPTSDGWLALDASLPEGSSSERVAIVIQRATSEQTAPLRLEAHGLTPREREIATMLVAGHTTTDLAQHFCLSPHTVQDHASAIYEKTGVRNRRELTARIFHEQYRPHLTGPAPVNQDTVPNRPS